MQNIGNKNYPENFEQNRVNNSSKHGGDVNSINREGSKIGTKIPPSENVGDRRHKTISFSTMNER